MSFELGVNYWPPRHAMYMWRELDLAEIRDDMAHIATMGFDTVRVFALAEDFLPAPLTVATDMVARLVEVVRAASDAGLQIVPTLIVINMSGRMWWPAWMRVGRAKRVDLFSDEVMLRSQLRLAHACGDALAGEHAIRAFDLANEIDGAQRPHSRGAARRWMRALAGVVRTAAPGTPVRIGAHLPSLTSANNMRIDDLGEVLDEDVVHAYPLYCSFARSFLDPELAPFACALTAGLAGPGRAAILQEFGLCTAPPGSEGRFIMDDFLGEPRTQYLASEDEAAVYYGEVLDRLATTGAAAAYAWCYCDYDSRLFDRPPLATAVRERTFGLVRADRSEKPAAAVVRAFRKRRDAGAVAACAPARVLDVSADEYYSAPEAHFERLYAAWLTGVAT